MWRNSFLIALIFLISSTNSQCPPGLTVLFQSGYTTPQTCTPQDSCSCYSSNRVGAICQYSSTYSNYICCYSTNTQCGTNSSPQTSATGLVVSCSTSTQCASGYICNYNVCCPNTSSNTCTSNSNNGCLTGQVLINGQCYNSVSIGSPCQQTVQCSGGSTCISSTCQCPSGYVNVNQQCVISNGINCQLGTVSYNSQCISLASPGQSCVTSSQCINNSGCTNGVCTCTSSYNLVYGYCVPLPTGTCLNTQTLVNNQCVLFSIVGETCIASSQCVGGATCSSSSCVCPSGYTAMYGYCISSTSCGQNQVAINGQCYNTVQTGGTCTFTQQCVNSGVCTNNICVVSTCYISCGTNQVCVNNQCLSYVNIGYQCTGSQQCLSSSQCINSICACPQGTQLLNGVCISSGGTNGQCSTNQVLYNNQCYNTVSIGQQCTITSQCLGYSQCLNSFCQCPTGTQNTNGQCISTGGSTTCSTNQVLYNNQCYNTVSVGQQCTITQQCLSNSQCLNYYCQCASGATLINGYCTGGSTTTCSSNQVLYNSQCYNTVSVGQQCTITQQCLGNSQCLNYYCQCASGATLINGYCTDGSTTTCSSNQVLYNNQCYNTVSVGQQCTITQQCLGNSQCLNYYCQCASGATLINGYCTGGTTTTCSSNQIYYNNQCYNTVAIGQQCTITQQCLSSSQCLNSFCQCPNGSSNINGQCTGTSTTTNYCSTGQTVQLGTNGLPINCLLTACPTSSFCQYSSTGQQYVCCR